MRASLAGDDKGALTMRAVQILARAVYTTNDRRAQIKRAIDELLGSELREEKSYKT
jgi:hypothetical protein